MNKILDEINEILDAPIEQRGFYEEIMFNRLKDACKTLAERIDEILTTKTKRDEDR